MDSMSAELLPKNVKDACGVLRAWLRTSGREAINDEEMRVFFAVLDKIELIPCEPVTNNPTMHMVGKYVSYRGGSFTCGAVVNMAAILVMQVLQPTFKFYEVLGKHSESTMEFADFNWYPAGHEEKLDVREVISKYDINEIIDDCELYYKVCDYLEALEPCVASVFYEKHWDAALEFAEQEHAGGSDSED